MPADSYLVTKLEFCVSRVIRVPSLIVQNWKYNSSNIVLRDVFSYESAVLRTVDLSLTPVSAMPCFFDLRGKSILIMGPSHLAMPQMGLYFFTALARNIGVRQSRLIISRLVLFFSGVLK